MAKKSNEKTNTTENDKKHKFKYHALQILFPSQGKTKKIMWKTLQQIRLNNYATAIRGINQIKFTLELRGLEQFILT